MNPALTSNLPLLLCLEFVLAIIGLGMLGISSIFFYVLRNKSFHLRGIALVFASSMAACGIGLFMLIMALAVPDQNYAIFTVFYLLVSGCLLCYVWGAVWMQIRPIRRAFHDLANRQQEIIDQDYLDNTTQERQSQKTLRALDAFDTSLSKHLAKAKGAV